MNDRDYYFWIATFDCDDGIDPVSAVEKILCGLRDAPRPITPVGYEIYRDVGSVSFELTGGKARAWQYCVIAELAPDTMIADLVARPPAILTVPEWEPGVQCLSSELAVRPQGAGTCIPRAAIGKAAMPSHYKVGIEYIYIPPGNWTDYQDFMRSVYGPIGKLLVEDDHFHKLIITERVCSFLHDPSMPEWNCVHISAADFDSETDGALARVSEAVRSYLGPDATIESSFAPVRGYRLKAKMSRNSLVYSTWPASPSCPSAS